MKFLLIYYNIRKTESSSESFEKQFNDNTVNEREEGAVLNRKNAQKN